MIDAGTMVDECDVQICMRSAEGQHSSAPCTNAHHRAERSPSGTKALMSACTRMRSVPTMPALSNAAHASSTHMRAGMLAYVRPRLISAALSIERAALPHAVNRSAEVLEALPALSM